MNATDAKNAEPAYNFADLRDTFLNGNIKKLIDLIDPHTEAPTLGLLLSYLSILSGAIATESKFPGGPYIQVSNKKKKSGRQRLLFNAILVGPTAAGKGTATDEILDLFSSWNEDWVDQHVKFGIPNSGAGFISSLHSAAQRAWYDEAMRLHDVGDPNAPEIPEEEKHFPTLPNLVQVRVATEWHKVLGCLSRDSDMGDIIRLLWEGKTVDNVTEKKGTVRVVTPHIPILAHISPEQYMFTLPAGELRGGTVNRIFHGYVDSLKELPFGGDMPEADEKVCVGIIRRAVEYGRKQGEIGWSAEARKAWSPKPGEGIYARIMEATRGRTVKAAFLGGRRALAQVRRIAALNAISNLRNVVEPVDLYMGEALMWVMVRSVEMILNERADSELVDEDEVRIEGDPSRANSRIMEGMKKALILAGPDGMTLSALNTKFRPKTENGDSDSQLVIDNLAAWNAKAKEANQPDYVMGRKFQRNGKGRKETRFVWIGPTGKGKDQDQDMPEATAKARPKKVETAAQKATPQAAEKAAKPRTAPKPATVPAKRPKPRTVVSAPVSIGDEFDLEL